MKPFKLSVHRFRLKKVADAEREDGFADMVEIEAKVKRYAIAKVKHKRVLIDPELAARLARGDFDVFSGDENCKSCRKKKAAE